MKKCTTCKVDKLDNEFNKNKSRKDGLNNICRTCSNKRSKKYYADNSDKHIKIIAIRRKKNRSNNQTKMLDFLKGCSCVDCGSSDYRVFEFDHINGDKKAHVSLLLSTGYSWFIIKKEIEKCEVVCCNCHRIRTITRSGSYRLI